MGAEEDKKSEPSAQSHVSPQVAQLSQLRRTFYDIIPGASFDDIAFTAGFNAAVEAAVYLAQIEELRVRNFVAESDGVCLDSEEERSRFLNGLYGAGDNTDR
jgi:hypothetical protein